MKLAAGPTIADRDSGAKMPLLPPGTILQHCYISERLLKLRPGKFIEVGLGRGFLTRMLLEMGWMGTAYDHSNKSILASSALNSQFIAAGQLLLIQGDWLEAPEEPRAVADMILSSMVIEHLDDSDERKYLEKVGRCLAPDGIGVLLVPGSPHHWGPEDVAVGHFRRYKQSDLEQKIRDAGLEVSHIAGLTYPLSNLLLPLSNAIVLRNMALPSKLSKHERTTLSGHRQLWLKNDLPVAAKLFLNRAVLYPFHLLQKIFYRNPRSLVIYAEFRKPETYGPINDKKLADL